MKQTIKNTWGTVALTSVLGLFSANLYAAETPAVVEGFSCKFNAGQGQADLDKAIAYWQTQMKAIYPEGSSYLGWSGTPVTGATEADSYWIGASPNLNAWAQGGVAYMGSEKGQAANARFDKVMDCQVNSYFSKPVYLGSEPEMDEDGSFAEVFACNLHEGKTMANVEAAEAMWVNVAKQRELPNNVHRWTPLYANTDYDVFYLSFHDNVISFGETITGLVTNPSGANAGFANTVKCDSWLMTGKTVYTPTSGWE